MQLLLVKNKLNPKQSCGELSTLHALGPLVVSLL